MKNTLGDNVRITLWGESHGKVIGAILDGVCPGILVDEEYIKRKLAKRRPNGKTDTARVEEDNFQIVSGVFNGYTTGEAIAIIIENNNVRSGDYSKLSTIARPSHADFVAYQKYHGFNDYRGGGHFSGRITASIVAAGAILLKALEEKGIFIGTHISNCLDLSDSKFDDCISEKSIIEQIKKINDKDFPVLNDEIENKMVETILKAAANKDSVGGILETAVVGLPLGLGAPWFSSVEGKIANALFGIGAIKGVEFGSGFDFSKMFGSAANDSFYLDNNQIKTKTNHNGGVNGGITNGMPVIFKCAVKPTPSIGQVQKTVDFKNMTETELEIKGRHDPAIIRRIAVVIDCVTAIVICDLLASRYGEDFLKF